MEIIDNNEKLSKACLEIAKNSIIYIDTEFYRRKTYFAKLCLIQIAARGKIYIIDTLVAGNLDELIDIFSNPEILKVFHAPQQDFTILYQQFKKLPVNVFDTQMAASLVGLKHNSSYSFLCESLLNVRLDKKHQSAFWHLRPLANELLDYAAKDVEYLVPIHRELSKTITDRKLWDSFNQRTKDILDVKLYQFNCAKYLQKLSLTKRSDDFIQKLGYFVEMREDFAKLKNLPRAHTADDSDLIEICDKLPRNDNEYKELSISRKSFGNQRKRKLIELSIALRETPDI